MAVIIAHQSTEAGKSATQIRLEQIFNAVDTIKGDANKCGMGMQELPFEEQGPNLENDSHSYTIRYLTPRSKKIETVQVKYFPENNSLKRKKNESGWKTILDDVSDFYVTYFPDANSLLYRIEIAKKEQVRGYVFLLNNL